VARKIQKLDMPDDKYF
jgi:hypothetical protein